VIDFDKRHGQNSIVVGGVHLYPDGAKRDEDPLGPLYEPPGDPFELARLKVIFHKRLVEMATDHFNQTRLNFQQSVEAALRSGFAPPDKEELIRQLKSIQSLVTARQKLHEEAFEELKATAGYQRRKEQEIQTAKNREQAQELKESLRAFQI
jgi:hypothetical protein